MILPAHVALTPVGNPLAPEIPLLTIPVAPVVLCVILDKAVLIHNVGADEAEPTELLELTTIVPVAFSVPQLVATGML
jgi:hypothetical protein